MRILHVSDLHIRESTLNDQLVLIQAFLLDVTEQHAERPVDVVIFSGDLAFGGKAKEFALAQEHVLDPLLSKLGLSVDRLVLTRGNHDTDIADIDDFVEAGLRAGLDTRDAVNNVLDNKKALLSRYDERGKAWRKFAGDYLGDRFLSGGLAQVTRIAVGDLTLAIAAVDSAWRATGAGDDGDFQHLLVGDRQIKDAVTAVKDADVVALCLHHPLDWLAPFDAADVRRSVERSCHLLFTGHTHAADPKSLISASGAYIHSQAGSLYGGRDYINAYTILDVDRPAGTCHMTFRSYQVNRESFDLGVDVAPSGQLELKLPEKTLLPATVPARRDTTAEARATREYRLRILRERSVLADLLHDRDQATVSELLVPPVFLPLPHDQFLVARDPKTGRRPGRTDPLASLRDGQRCVVIVGEEASGLSSALDWMALTGEPDGRPVLRLAWSDIKGGLQAVEKALRLAFFVHGYEFKSSDPIPDGVILVDDIRDNAEDDRRLQRFLRYMQTATGSTFILGCRPSDEKLVTAALTGQGHAGSPHYLGPFGRGELRTLVSRLNVPRASTVFEAVTGMLEREGLARTPFIMAALVSVVGANETFAAAGNETAVLDAYADLLLGRSEVATDSRIAMDYRDREHLLASLAERMMDGNSARLPRLQIEKFLVEYFERIGWSEPVSEVISALVERRVLWETGDGLLSFRQPALLGLFAAKRMLDEPAFKEGILRTPLRHPAVVRHAAALRRNDRELLTRVHDMLAESPTSEVAQQFFSKAATVDQEGDDSTSDRNAQRLMAPLRVRPDDGVPTSQLSLDDSQDAEDDRRTPTTEVALRGPTSEEARAAASESEERYDALWDELHATPVQDVIVPNELPPIWQFEAAACLVSSVLRSSELVADTELKKELLKEVVSAWAGLSALVASNHTINEQARDAFTRLFGVKEDEKSQQVLDDMVQLLPIMISMGNMNIYLASKKLGVLLSQVLEEDEFMSQPGPAMMATLLAMEIKTERWVQHADALIDRHGDRPVVRQAVEWFAFTLYRGDDSVRGSDLAALESLLVKLVISGKRTGGPSRSRKDASRIAASLRKTRNQAAITHSLSWSDSPVSEEDEP